MSPLTQIKHAKLKERVVDMDISAFGLIVRNNVKIELWDEDMGASDDAMFHVWFHTAFLDSNYLCFDRTALDKAVKVRCGSEQGLPFPSSCLRPLFFVLSVPLFAPFLFRRLAFVDWQRSPPPSNRAGQEAPLLSRGVSRRTLLP